MVYWKTFILTILLIFEVSLSELLPTIQLNGSKLQFSGSCFNWNHQGVRFGYHMSCLSDNKIILNLCSSCLTGECIKVENTKEYIPNHLKCENKVDESEIKTIVVFGVEPQYSNHIATITSTQNKINCIPLFSSDGTTKSIGEITCRDGYSYFSEYNDENCQLFNQEIKMNMDIFEKCDACRVESNVYMKINCK